MGILGMGIMKVPNHLWKLYSGKEFISFLGFRPCVRDIIKMDELHAVYQIESIDNRHTKAQGRLINVK